VTDERIAVSRTIRASAADIFKIVSHPQGHVDVDGSGMLEAAPDARALTAAGDTFAMDMDREPLGDVPLGKYKVLNVVTQLVPDRLVEWTVGSAERSPLGHLYGWALEPVGDDATEVTNYCDWSRIPEKLKGRITWPVVPVSMLERSLDNLERIVTAPAG
jgi:hypothetical protein